MIVLALTVLSPRLASQLIGVETEVEYLVLVFMKQNME